jgi:hypothetical protein
MKTAKGHMTTVWTRDLRRTAWAWSCLCGRRYAEDLPSIEAARTQAGNHLAEARNG